MLDFDFDSYFEKLGPKLEIGLSCDCNLCLSVGCPKLQITRFCDFNVLFGSKGLDLRRAEIGIWVRVERRCENTNSWTN